MIVETMTRDEVIKEMNADVTWFEGKTPGLCKKYHKALKDRNVKHNTLLGVSSYTTPNNNKVRVCHVKYCYTNNYTDMVYNIMFEMTTNTGQTRYIYPWYDTHGLVKQVVVFTSHCIERLNERSGLTSLDLQRLLTDNDGAMSFKSYEYNGETTLMCPLSNIGGIIGIEGEWGITAVTYITIEQQGINQLSCIVSGRRHIQEMASAANNAYLNDFSQQSRSWRRRVLRHFNTYK